MKYNPYTDSRERFAYWLEAGQGDASVIRNGRIVLIGALICFLIFFGNVASGAAGLDTVLGDVAEMLTLLAASLLFVTGVLMLEVADNRNTDPR